MWSGKGKFHLLRVSLRCSLTKFPLEFWFDYAHIFEFY